MEIIAIMGFIQLGYIRLVLDRTTKIMLADLQSKSFDDQASQFVQQNPQA
jgi:hypothetical protein